MPTAIKREPKPWAFYSYNVLDGCRWILMNFNLNMVGSLICVYVNDEITSFSAYKKMAYIRMNHSIQEDEKK